MKTQILVVKLSSLGDILHALPVVAALQRELDAEIDWAVQPAFAGLVESFACVTNVIRTPRPSDLVGYFRAIRMIRRKRYDVVLDLQGLLKSAIVSRAARAPRVIGPSFAREGSRFFYSELSSPLCRKRSRHAVDELFDFLGKFSVPIPEKAAFPLRLPEAFPDEWGKDVANESGPRIAIAPFSRWTTKNWPAGHFSALCRLLSARYKARLYLIGGAGDRTAAQAIADEAGVPVANLCGKLSLLQSAALLRVCTVLVTNDSGPMHLSVAVGTPCVALFGPTSPNRTGPYGSSHTVLQATGLPSCCPCHSRSCGLKSGICLHSISPEMVLSAIEKNSLPSHSVQILPPPNARSPINLRG